MLATTQNSEEKETYALKEKRQSLQPLLPQVIPINKDHDEQSYNLYPFRQLGAGKINTGYPSLASWVADYSSVIIDGYSGVFWDEVRDSLTQALAEKGIETAWINVMECLKKPKEIEALIAPFLGESASLWGTKCTLGINDFYDLPRLETLRELITDSKGNNRVTICYGVGASLVSTSVSPVIFLDVPKNEIQYRMRAGSVTNLGNDKTTRASEMYKRFYFVDWVVLNAHKKAMLNTASIFADVQWSGSISWMTRETLHDALFKMSRSVFRVRPWFEAGAWGGHWMKERFAALSKDEVNYAWSFELIVPENGIVFESDGRLLELSFDTLMYSQSEAVLGKHAAYFGDEFPIRFDFLDTWDGGNLSIQCHPTLSYMRKNFGEKLTQDETYYILDCKPGAVVYLGFQENIDPAAFRNELEKSRNENAVVDVDRYVQSHVAAKHDLFLIPNGTVHSAGANNLVLEISATPYIFTFKMYDWLRLDLNGEPRAINIGHAFNNLSFERKGDRVKEELIANPVILSGGADSQLVHLPTHPEHFYDVHRIEFDSDVLVHTNGSCHVLMVVEGDGVIVESTDGSKSNFSFAETFVVPAAATAYRLINSGRQRVKVVKAFIKDQIDFLL